MQALVDKFNEYEKERAWNKVFIDLQAKSDDQEKKLGLTSNVANKEVNQAKNRYCNVIPYDFNRVLLPSSKNNYINASTMHSEVSGRDYIFSQGPLESTSADFWSMIYHEKTRIIVMLTDVIEWGQHKCHNYFPAENDEKTKRFGIYIVELIEEEKGEWFTLRKIKLTPKKGASTEPRTIHHFQYTNWPDFGVPEDTIKFEKLIEAVRDLDDSFEDKKPIVSHCSAGIGRTGTFAVADILITALRSNIKTDSLPMIDDLILEMRKSRMWLVQTPAQLRFAWQAVVNWIRRSNGGLDAVEVEDLKSCCKPAVNTNGDAKVESAPVSQSPVKRLSTEDDAIIQKSVEGKRSKT